MAPSACIALSWRSCAASAGGGRDRLPRQGAPHRVCWMALLSWCGWPARACAGRGESAHVLSVLLGRAGVQGRRPSWAQSPASVSRDSCYCPSVLVPGCPQGKLGRALAGGGLAESGAVAEGFTSCSECWYGFGAPLWDRAGDPGPRDPVPPVPWGCRCLHRTRSGGLTTLPPPGRFAKPPRTLGVWFPRGQWGGFAPLCPAPAAGNDELEIVVPHGARLVSREVSGTRVWHQVLTCRAPIFYFFSGGSPQLNMAHRCVSGSWARDVDPCCSCPRDLLPWICSSGPRPCPPPRGASCPGGRHFFRKAWL